MSVKGKLERLEKEALRLSAALCREVEDLLESLLEVSSEEERKSLLELLEKPGLTASELLAWLGDEGKQATA